MLVRINYWGSQAGQLRTEEYTCATDARFPSVVAVDVPEVDGSLNFKLDSCRLSQRGDLLTVDYLLDEED